ncbi:MAG: histidinol dehydrogenase [Bacteroidales bacterium]|nr:histidinol dehydrogenase [Bacteroidales bacterium]
MEIIKFPEKNKWKEILQRPILKTEDIDRIVIDILNDIKRNGDKAIFKYTAKFDRVDLSVLQIKNEEIEKAILNVDEGLKKSIKIAKNNIEKFHTSQKTERKIIETTKGVKCWQKAVPIEKVGLYIPGGTAPLFSTVLMLGIPAKIAGCEEIILCTPPGKDGQINPVILYTAKLIGISKIFKIGGIQAIAAMAYGTETVPKVYKIFGPGNQYVTAAKQIVSRSEVAIDMPAGPSEVAVLADNMANPAFIVSDLLSQAEHGADSQVLLFTIEERIIEPVLSELEKQLKLLPRKDYAKKSLKNSKIILVKDKEEMIEMVNEYAPEHLIISMKNYNEIAERIINAGSVFLGNYTPESAGDYASGTNHTLPTYGFARFYNGTNLDDYVKKITFQEISKEGLKNLGPVIEKMAEAEDLFAHKNAVSIRLKNIENRKQKTENRKQKIENRKQKTENRKQKTENRK